MGGEKERDTEGNRENKYLFTSNITKQTYFINAEDEPFHMDRKVLEDPNEMCPTRQIKLISTKGAID